MTYARLCLVLALLTGNIYPLPARAEMRPCWSMACEQHAELWREI